MKGVLFPEHVPIQIQLFSYHIGLYNDDGVHDPNKFGYNSTQNFTFEYPWHIIAITSTNQKIRI